MTQIKSELGCTCPSCGWIDHDARFLHGPKHEMVCPYCKTNYSLYKNVNITYVTDFKNVKTTNTDDIICPYCFTEQTDYNVEDGQELQCIDCESSFYVFLVHREVQYITKKKYN